MAFALELLIVAVGFWQAYRMGYARGLSQGLSLQIEQVFVRKSGKDEPNG